MEPEEPEHHIRFSLEFKSIRDLKEPFCIYFKFSHQLLGVGRTQSYNAAKMIESNFQQEFQSHECYLTRVSLIEALGDFSIELWHNDMFQKDLFLGIFVINLQEILSAELKKTETSVIRVLDAVLKEDFGTLRVVFFLEDLGPKTLMTVDAIPQQENDWELQVWRKSEETKFLSELKSRENEYLKTAAAEWVKKEILREEQNERVMVELGALEVKLRGKMLELQKRETKISSIEEEIKLQTNDFQKQIDIKEEELGNWRNKLTDTKSSVAKEVKSLRTAIQQAKDDLNKVEEETIKLRKLSESQELKELKKELSQRLAENTDLQARYEQIRAVKEDFEQRLYKLKADLSKTLRLQDMERKEKERKEREEVTRRRVELETIRYQHEEAVQIQEVKDKMLSLRSLIR